VVYVLLGVVFPTVSAVTDTRVRRARTGRGIGAAESSRFSNQPQL